MRKFASSAFFDAQSTVIVGSRGFWKIRINGNIRLTGFIYPLILRTFLYKGLHITLPLIEDYKRPKGKRRLCLIVVFLLVFFTKLSLYHESCG